MGDAGSELLDEYLRSKAEDLEVSGQHPGAALLEELAKAAGAPGGIDPARLATAFVAELSPELLDVYRSGPSLLANVRGRLAGLAEEMLAEPEPELPEAPEPDVTPRVTGTRELSASRSGRVLRSVDGRFPDLPSAWEFPLEAAEARFAQLARPNALGREDAERKLAAIRAAPPGGAVELALWDQAVDLAEEIGLWALECGACGRRYERPKVIVQDTVGIRAPTGPIAGVVIVNVTYPGNAGFTAAYCPMGHELCDIQRWIA